MKKTARKHYLIISIICLVIIAIGSYFYFTQEKESLGEFVVAERGNVIQEVDVTGKVKASKTIELAFEKSGIVNRVSVNVGDRVSSGQILASLSNAELLTQLAQVEAGIKAQKAKLDELKRGSKEEEIKLYEAKAASARSAIEDAQKNIIDKLQDSYTKADDGVRNKLDQIFSNPRTSNPQLIFIINNVQLDNEIRWLRLVSEDLLNSWNISLSKLTSGSDIGSYVNEAKENLNKIKLLLDKASFVVNDLILTTGISQTTINTWKSDISSARTNINTAISNISSAEEKLKLAENNLIIAQSELSLKKSGATIEQIAAQEAQIEEAEANLSNIKVQLEKMVLRSPAKGTISKVDIEAGEIAGANKIIITLISESKFEIEANVPEADIAKIKIGNQARITLDAFGNDVVFEAIVAAIEPAETIIESVATYKTTLHFTKEDSGIKSGMTANIDILTDKRENVIFTPIRAVIEKNNEKIVRIISGETIIEKKVKAGIKGSDGNMEIIEGVKEGDKIVISD